MVILMVIFDDIINTVLLLKTVRCISVWVHLDEERRVQSIKSNITSEQYMSSLK